MRGVERLWALLCPEAFRSGSRVTVKDKEVNALRNLARLTSLIWTHSGFKQANLGLK